MCGTYPHPPEDGPAKLWLALLCLAIVCMMFGCSEPRKALPVPDLTEQFDILESRMIWAQARVMHWEELRYRHQQFNRLPAVVRPKGPALAQVWR